MAEIIALSKWRLLADVYLIQRSRQYFIRESGFIPSCLRYAQGTERSFGRFERGAGFCRRAPLLAYGSLGMFEKKICRNFGRFGICPAHMQPRCSGRRLLLCDKPPTGQTPVSTANTRRRVKFVRELSI